MFGYSMKSMNSPDEPTFWMHHCNIDRLYHTWCDCQGYDLIDKDDLTDNQYTPANPLSVQKDAKPKYDPMTTTEDNPTGDPYTVRIVDKICYYWSSKTNSKVFPSNSWPTFRDLWGLGKSETDKGHDGIYYRYGPDNSIVATDPMKKNSPDKTWRWVDQPIPALKRSVAGGAKKLPPHRVVQRINERFHEKVYRGLTNREALRELAMEECLAIPKQQVTKDLLQFIEMNGGDLAEYDRICDKADNAITDKKEDKPALEAAQSTVEIDNGQMMTPVWVIVVASVGSVIGVIVIVIIIIYILKKRREASCRKWSIAAKVVGVC